MSSYSAALFLPITTLFFLLPYASAAQNRPAIALGSSLSPQSNRTSLWALSPSGDFAFGFLPLELNRFLLAIWFANIPAKTVVWFAGANGEAAVVQAGSRAELTITGRLSLINHTGQEIWLANPGGVAANCTMLDTGNLVLAHNSTAYAWQSFDNPTDTILPTQVIKQGGKLSSRRSSRQNDYSGGRFQLRLLLDGNLVMNTIGYPTQHAYERYWISENTFKTDDMVIFDPNAGVQVVMGNNTSLFNVTVTSFATNSDFYQRATLDSDGVLRQYKHSKSSTNTRGSSQDSWSVMDFVPKDICKDLVVQFGGSGACGFNSYCSLNGNQPNCFCPDHYCPSDPDDIGLGCRPEFEEPSCEQYDPAEFDLVEMNNADWPYGDYEMLSPTDHDGCRAACLEDCRCMVAMSKGGDCWKKKMPLSNGLQDPSINEITIFKVRKVDSLNASWGSSPTNIGNNSKNQALISVSSVGCSVLINFIVAGSTLLLLSKRRKSDGIKTESKAVSSNLQAFSYTALEKATDKFKEELGKGSFGSVYKGVLVSQGQLPIAVKRLSGITHQGEKEFIAEVSVIGRTHHKNLVQLIGFCNEGLHRLLVYEFMSNGSLASYLFQSEKPRWERRLKIAYGVARGLAYLHDECTNQIIHCDIKPQNILLDEYLTARISDFGLAKLLLTDQTRTTTSIKGTKGYVAPEWFKDKGITSKVDVYSFGVVLLEIICCRKNVEKLFGEDQMIILTEWAYECYREKRLEVLVQYDEDATSDHRRLEIIVAVALWCIQEEPSMRPSMTRVTQMLEGAVEVSVPPEPFSLISTTC